MKKFLVALFLIMVSAPMYADVINPKLSSDEYKKIREQRQERYKIRQRQSYINNICGLNSKSEAFDRQSVNKCKAELKKEYDATIKLVEKIAKENKKNAKQKAASSD